jgi:hypothetical protein
MTLGQGHVKVALAPDSDCADLLAAPQTSFPLILTFGEEAFSSAVVLSTGQVAQLGSGGPLALAFLAPHAALQFAVPSATFKFMFPPSCTGTGVVLEVLGA